jgi:hypothetical protein
LALPGLLPRGDFDCGDWLGGDLLAASRRDILGGILVREGMANSFMVLFHVFEVRKVLWRSARF